MKFKINKDKLKIDNNTTQVSSTINYYNIEIEFDETWEGLTKEARLIKRDASVGIKRPVLPNNTIYIDEQEYGQYSIGFIGYTIEDEQKVYQISTNLEILPYIQGAGEIETQEEELPTPSEWERYIQEITELLGNIHSIPEGGEEGQVLKKKSNIDYDVDWEDEQGGGGGTSNHNELNKLDFEHSGHTGFQPAGNYVEDNDYVHTDNNYTSAEKAKLDGIETGAEVNDIEDVLVNGVSVVENKIASVSVPTKTSDLTNDSNFVSENNLKTIKGQSLLGTGDIPIKESHILGKSTDYSSTNRLNLDNLKVGSYILLGPETGSREYLYVSVTYNGNTLTADATINYRVEGFPSSVYMLKKVEDAEENEVFAKMYFLVTSNTYTSWAIQIASIKINRSGNLEINTSSSMSILDYVSPSAAQTITGKKTFNTLPESSKIPTTDNQLVNKKYVDDMIAQALSG